MQIQWVTAFLDHPADSGDSFTRFWQVATGSAVSTRRGERGQFATMLPPDGTPHLRLQETDDGAAGIHIDLHVHDVAAAADRAEDRGASRIVTVDNGLILMQSPAGLTFCFVSAVEGALERSSLTESPAGPYTFDQVSIDIPFDDFEAECTFWSDLTGWPVHGGSVPEFRVLPRSPDMALRLLLHRLGRDDLDTNARAHLDAAVGTHGEAIAAWHESLGATIEQRGRHWITMRDPAGLPYCLTERDPVHGSLPPASKPTSKPTS